jgi:hypothetical protein
MLDSIKSATGFGEPTYTGQAKQGAHDLKEGAKSEFNSVSFDFTFRRPLTDPQLTSGSNTGTSSSGGVSDSGSCS